MPRARKAPPPPPAATAPTRLGPRFLWQLTRPYRWKLLAGLILLMVGTACMMAIPQILKHMFDNALLAGDKTALAHTAYAMFGLTFIMVAGVMARSQLIQLNATRIACDMREVLVRHLLTLDVAWFESQASGALISRLTNDVIALREFVQTALPMGLRGVLVTVCTLVAMALTSPSLAAILLACALPAILISARLGGAMRALSRNQSERLAAFSAALGEQVSHPALWRAFGQEQRAMADTRTLLASIIHNSRKQLLTGSGMVAANVLVGFIGITLVVWQGGLQVMDGTLTLGSMLAFVLYLGFLSDGASNLAGVWPLWQNVLAAMDRVNEILEARSNLPEPAAPATLPAAKHGRVLELKNVGFTYPARPDTQALEGFTLTIPAGKTTALVGPSGIGKSTVLRLLLRLDDPTTGNIKLDGIDLKNLSLATVRAQFALVAQDTPIINGTVADNVAFAKPDATDEELWQALKDAAAADFVKALPKGLYTVVGERGVQLSGGQRQRIALARALVADAPVLLLDEATSHLDTDSENAIQKALAKAAKGRTVVVVAHRLSTIQGAEQIAVLDRTDAQGTHVVATGTHAQLLKSSPLYKALNVLSHT